MSSCANRRTGDGTIRIEAEMAEVRVKGRRRIEVRDRHGNTVKAVLELRFRCVRVLPPAAKQKNIPPLEMTVVYAQERGNPKELRTHRLEAALRSSCPLWRGGDRETPLVCDTVEN